MKKILTGKKVAMIIAFQDFRDIEYFAPKDILLDAGAEIITVSTKKGIAKGADGGEAEVSNSIDELEVEDFDGIIFIGGSGMVKQLDNEKFHAITKKVISANKILGAICIAPAILAKSGVLNGKNSTVWSNDLDKSAIDILNKYGAKYRNEAVVVDGKIVTASGPEAAEKFGKVLIKELVHE